MSEYVEITFDCLPLRSIGRLDIPFDAPPEYQILAEHIKQAIRKHGLHNTYYLHNARCVFHVTNDPAVGTLEFSFEGTVLTDPDDQRTLSCDVQCQLRRETCDWLTEPVVGWFAQSVQQAVRVEFDRFISAGDLHKTLERLDRLRAEADQQGGFLGMGL